MGWIYENRLAYGITVYAWGYPGLKELLESFKHLLDYDAKMSLAGLGTLFIYIKSTYKVIKTDSGFYAQHMPDISGDDFTPPAHPCLHRIEDTLMAPKQSIDEFTALLKVKRFCHVKEAETWVQHAYITHISDTM